MRERETAAETKAEGQKKQLFSKQLHKLQILRRSLTVSLHNECQPDLH